MLQEEAVILRMSRSGRGTERTPRPPPKWACHAIAEVALREQGGEEILKNEDSEEKFLDEMLKEKVAPKSEDAYQSWPSQAAQSQELSLELGHFGPQNETTQLEQARLSARGRGSDCESFLTVREDTFTILDTWRPRSTTATQLPSWGTNDDLSVGDLMGQMNTDIPTSTRSLTKMTIEGHNPGCFSRLITYPSSRKRVCWDIVGIIMLTYDLVVLPLQAFPLPESEFTWCVGWVVRIFWSLDLVLNFFVGYFENGILIVSPERIAKHYLCTFLLFDVFLISIDWVGVIFDDGEDSTGTSVSRFGRTVRFLRFIRTLRLLRLVKLKQLMETLQDLVSTEVVSIYFSISKSVSIILSLNHIIGCAWYALGDMDDADPTGWVRSLGFNSQTLGYRYTTSFHWSITQFTPASMAIQPHNTRERTFAVVIIVFALIVFSSFVSSITTAMAQLRNMNNHRASAFWKVRRYMKVWNVSKMLYNRVLRYLEYVYDRQMFQTISDRSVELLKLLSEPLFDELRAEIDGQLLTRHPFFLTIQMKSRMALAKICRDAIVPASLARTDVLFSPGQTCKGMYFIRVGRLVYSSGFGKGSQKKRARQKTVVEDGQWLCEGALWTSFTHRGKLKAETECTLLLVNAPQFGEALMAFEDTWRPAADYAKGFVDNLNIQQDAKLDITDLEHDHFRPEDWCHRNRANSIQANPKSLKRFLALEKSSRTSNNAPKPGPLGNLASYLPEGIQTLWREMK